MVVVQKLKDKCKDAARTRREKERNEFVELSKLLPLPSSTTNQLDKASIIRLTSSYLRMRSAFPEGLGENWGTRRRDRAAYRDDTRGSSELPAPAAPQTQANIRELGSLILQTLDGFVFALHRDGKIMYISETASVLLGLPQIDLTGSSIFEYIHPADHADLQNILNLNETDRLEIVSKQSCGEESGLESPSYHEGVELSRSFCVRMKCILPKRNAGLVSNGYKAIHCCGYLKVRRALQARCLPGSKSASSRLFGRVPGQQQDRPPQGNDEEWASYALVAVGHSLLPTASTEVRLGSSTFMFRANLDLKLYYIEPTVSSLLGYSHGELVGHSLYQFVHVADLGQVEQAHRQILEKGQAVSRYFRLMRQGGGHIWIQTNGTLINNPRSIPKPQHIVGICSVIGENLSDRSCSMIVEQDMSQQIEPLARTISSGGQTQSKKLKSLGEISVVPKDKNNLKRIRKSAAMPQAGRVKVRTDTMTSENYRLDHYNTIGSQRRPSDDNCSIVSSIASTSTSSSSSSASSTSGIGSTLSGGPPSCLCSLSTISSSSVATPSDTSPPAPTLPYASAKCYSQMPTFADGSKYREVNTSYRDQTGETQEFWTMTSHDDYGLFRPVKLNGSCNSFEQQATDWPSTGIVASPLSVMNSTLPGQVAHLSGPQTAIVPQDHTYLCNQYDHLSGGIPLEGGHYYDNCTMNYQNDVQISMASKDSRIKPFHNNVENAYQHQYQLQQGTTHLSGQSAS